MPPDKHKVEELAATIDRCAKALWDLVWAFEAASDVPGHEEHAYRVAETVAALAEVQQHLWDLEPDLVDEESRPKTEVDLVGAFNGLRAGHPEVRGSAREAILDDAPDRVVAAVRGAATDAERDEILRAWWAKLGPRLRPIDRLNRELDAKHRWRRIHVARALSKLGEAELIDPTTGDLDPEAVLRWRARERR